jgi:hypothetical protein
MHERARLTARRSRYRTPQIAQKRRLQKIEISACAPAPSAADEIASADSGDDDASATRDVIAMSGITSDNERAEAGGAEIAGSGSGSGGEMSDDDDDEKWGKAEAAGPGARAIEGECFKTCLHRV